MTKEQLKSYISMRDEISELGNKLVSLGEGDEMLDNSVIMNYKKGYPVPQAVVGFNWEKYISLKERYRKRISVLMRECEVVEKYVENIKDSRTRRIFRMYYLEGRSQKEISRIIHIDRSTVSKKLNAPEP